MVSKRKAGKQRPPKAPAPGATVYSGPIRQQTQGTVDDAVVVRMSYPATVAGTTNGVQMAANNSSLTSCTDWAAYANLYDEYRVLGFSLGYYPHQDPGNSSLVHGAGFRFDTHSSETFVLPTPDVCVQHADWKIAYTGRQFVHQWKMDGIEESVFLNTASAASAPLLGTINVTIPNATTASQYGIAVVTYAVQLRGRK